MAGPDPILERLDKIIELLETQKKQVNPVHPRLPDFPTPIPVDRMTSCPKCNIKLDSVMGYVCSVHGCPTGLGPTAC